MVKQISNEELLDLTKQAFEKGELFEFFQGKPPYTCPVNHSVPANIPTDFGRIINYGIYKFYEKQPNNKIISDLREAISKLIEGDAVQIWIAFMICLNILRNEERKSAAFSLNSSEIYDKLRISILSHEQDLRECKEWQGWNEDNGLWSEILRINKNCGGIIL
jgi:hypothetical protein